MINRLLLIGVLCLFASGLRAATYAYTGTPYATVTNFTAPCGAGSCASFTTSMSATGTFTTGAPIAPNLSNSDISDQITSYSFSDGLTTYSSVNPNGRIAFFSVNTDASGTITPSLVLIELWASGTAPHTAGDRLSALLISPVVFPGTSPTAATFNRLCSAVGTGGSGVTDACLTTPVVDLPSSYGYPPTIGSFVRTDVGTPSSVPTLSEWAIVLLFVLMGAAGCQALSRASAGKKA